MNTQPAQRLVFTEKQQVSLESFNPGLPAEGEVLVRTQLSLMSTGTENIVFNRLFEAGSHWDHWVKYPFYPGYTSVGTVEALGPGATCFAVGDRVAFRVGHRSHAVVAEKECYPIPLGLSFEEAVWFSLAKIAFHGARVADYRLGNSVLIIGAGPIGQMSIRWAKAAGAASILVVDPMPSRMAFAKLGGATATIDLPVDQAREKVLAANGGKPPPIVIDTTGNAAVFTAALGLVEYFGKVVLLGDTGQPTRQSLTKDVLTRGITIVGVHDGHDTADWNNATISQLFFTLVKSDRFSLANLNTHTFKPADCAEAYLVANRDRASTMGILFEWI
jgi:2-desacetyl-2-hydroxyethyl bacteriochlorophyllide A dehydrogenase